MKMKVSFLPLIILVLFAATWIQLSQALPSGKNSKKDDSTGEDDSLDEDEDDDDDGYSIEARSGLSLPVDVVIHRVTSLSASENVIDPCVIPRQTGPCKLYLPRYFFNPYTGQCEPFVYGGCGGNENNFATIRYCESQCSGHLKNFPSIQETISEENQTKSSCELPPVLPGKNCRAHLPRWTFDSEVGKCIQFIYTGCQTQTSNFYYRKYECQQKCGNYSKPTPPPSTTRRPSQIKVTQQKLPTRICALGLDTGSCYGNEKRFYFNSERNRCFAFTFTGCGGNDNNFLTGEECLRTCGGSTPASNAACFHVSCPTNLYSHYDALGCEPLYDGNACCPTRFHCPTSTNVSSNSTNPVCQYRGRTYVIGQHMPEASSESACRSACTCAQFGDQARIDCASIECPENLGAIPIEVENCTRLYRKGSCCAHDFHCENTTEVEVFQVPETNSAMTASNFRCYYDGREYIEGERFELHEDMCQTCTCLKGFNGTLKSEFCDPIDCGIEIYYADELQRGCVPVYYQDTENRIRCCPIGWECPGDEAEVSQPKPAEVTSPFLQPSLLPSLFRPENMSRIRNVADRIVTSDVCVQPRDVGPCRAARPRYYFNQMTLTCEAFTYSGCGGTENNFVSLGDCRRICEENAGDFRQSKSIPTLVPRPRQPSPQHQHHQTSKSFLGMGPKTYELTEVDPCTLEPKLGPCRGYFRRFYFAPQLNQCQTFTYGGCNSNQNNFYTLESCTAYCLGRILTSEGDEEPTNQTNHNTPPITPIVNRTLTTVIGESRGISILDNEIPCSLPVIVGPCRGMIVRFYFDPIAATCEEFNYSGCAGNSNNFLKLQDCQSRCQFRNLTRKHPATPLVASLLPDPTVIRRKRCDLPMARGPCFSLIPSFYFNAQTQTCEAFDYGGCFGNSNRFDKIESCQNACHNVTINNQTQVTSSDKSRPTRHNMTLEPSDIQPNSEELCQLSLERGSCDGHFLRFGWTLTDELTGGCIPFIYSGCGGNGNNFLSESACLSTCSAIEPPIERLIEDETLSCTFGNRTIPIGQSLNNSPPIGSTCGRPLCTCTTPPGLTCIQRQCPHRPFLFEPSTTTTSPSITNSTTKLCPILNCIPGCVELAPTPNACPICTCPKSGFNPKNCPPLPCIVSPRPCQRGTDPETGCPICLCPPVSIHLVSIVSNLTAVEREINQ